MNREEINARRRALRASNPALYRERDRLRRDPASQRAWRAAHPTYHRDRDLSRRYGLSLEAFNELVVAQRGLCAICRRPPTARGLFVDHDHETGAVRALLCLRCNHALGQFDDDPTVIRAAADYVEAHRASFKHSTRS